MAPILQLVRRGAVARHPQEAAAALAGEFRARRCATVPALIEPSLLGRIQAPIARVFVERAHGVIATERCTRAPHQPRPSASPGPRRARFRSRPACGRRAGVPIGLNAPARRSRQ